MLQILRTEDNAGVLVIGAYEDLYALREAISNIIGDKKDYEGYEYVNSVVQHFCYELIHAYRAERDSFMTNFDTPCYKFPVLFPEIIFIINALNDYIILSDTDQFYINGSENVSDAIRETVSERKYIDRAYIRFFQASVWNAVKGFVGHKVFTEIMAFRNFDKICSDGDLRYYDYCKDWIDLLNIRYINCENDRDVYLVDIIKKLAQRDDEYISKEKAMKEHAKDGNISLYLNLLSELNYPDEWDW
ncbi:hypothetical protein SDC9_70852 [bioreactor metagenome]|uniref:Uncharacterized protein n=1 Tax=bioreactor metagenome TaxID=1076179 RepID=A0A644Y7C8_9ZZZZ|nr:hypothetical protein [Candidatus Metalachnospira sp.]